jgi:hypothetical protein
MENEQKLHYVRKGAFEFLQTVKNYTIPDGKIVEVGKSVPEGKVYEQYPQFYVNTKELVAPRELVQIDIDPLTEPDICCDIIEIDKHFDTGTVGAVILMHVLEHVKKFWLVPQKLHSILVPGGLVFIQTPWNFRFHGPRPDCWRISDDGYQALFDQGFEFVSLEQYNPMNEYLHPIVMNVVLKKI